MPSSKKKANPGKAGRPKGQKATINKRPDKVDCTEIVDFDRCPGCGGKNISENPTDKYDRIVKRLDLIVKTIKYVTVRRWCRDCKKQVSAKPPETAPHARYGANVGAVLNFLNMSGLSHARSVEFAGDALGTPVSCSSAYRNKISRARQMAPERDAVREEILKEPHLGADEFHWPLEGGRRGYGVVALGKRSCLVEIVDSRKIKTVKGVLPGYGGTLTQDSYPAWLHVGSARQMCVVHQERLVQKDLEWNPGGDVAEFLAGLSAVHKKIYRAWRVKDPHSRAVAADCIDAELAGLFAAPYKDDKYGTIAKYRKRRYREGYYTKSEKLMRLSHILPHLELYQFHVPQSMKIKTMLKRYAAETDCDTKDRMMLIIRVKRDGITMRDSAKSPGKSASWGYKWHERYLEVGFDRLGNMPRSGRPTRASKADMKKIRKAACRRPVWTGMEMQQYTQQKTGVRYELGYVRQILRGWGYSQKVPVGKHARRAPDEEIRKFQKEMPDLIKKEQ